MTGIQDVTGGDPGPLRDEPGQRPVLSRETLHRGMVWDLVRDSIDFAPGVRFAREYIWHTGAVAVLAVDESDRVLLIKQYRHPVGHSLWEIPAGLLDVDGEAAHVAAARELTEETGYLADELATLVDLRPSPGGNDEVIRVYLATGLRPAEAAEEFERTDEEAELVSRWVPLSEAVAAVLAGDVTNGTTVSALLALQALRAGGPQHAAPRPADAPWMERPGR